MDYNKLINNSLTKAFLTLKSLSVSVTLNLKSDVSFDFSTGDTVETSSTVVSEAIRLNVIKKSKDHNTLTQQLLLKTEGIENLSLFDTITISGIIWKLGIPINSNGYVTVIDVTREA